MLWWLWWHLLLWWIRSLRSHEISNDTKCEMTQNVKWHEMSNDTKCQITQLQLHRMMHDAWCMMMDLWLQAETTGVTHFGAYNRPPDGHFFTWISLLFHIFPVVCLKNKNVQQMTFSVVGRACSSTASPVRRGERSSWSRSPEKYLPTAISSKNS